MLQMTQQKCLAAAILAGGRARRFGEIDKSALTIDGDVDPGRGCVGRPAIDHSARLRGRRSIRRAPRRRGSRSSRTRSRTRVPLGGIYTAIVASPCDRTLVVGCDMPFLTERFLRHLVERSHTLSVMPRTTQGYEPLCAIYARESAAAMRNRLERGERQAASLPGGVQVVEVGPEELAAFDPHGLLFVNVNTPQDYAQARRRLDGVDPPIGSGRRLN